MVHLGPAFFRPAFRSFTRRVGFQTSPDFFSFVLLELLVPTPPWTFLPRFVSLGSWRFFPVVYPGFFLVNSKSPPAPVLSIELKFSFLLASLWGLPVRCFFEAILVWIFSPLMLFPFLARS